MLLVFWRALKAPTFLCHVLLSQVFEPKLGSVRLALDDDPGRAVIYQPGVQVPDAAAQLFPFSGIADELQQEVILAPRRVLNQVTEELGAESHILLIGVA